MMIDCCVEPPAADQDVFLVERDLPTITRDFYFGLCLQKGSLKGCSILITLGNANHVTTIIWTDAVPRAL